MLLAQNIALRNPGFTEDDLNFAVQQTIDRIIFLRIAEDRGVEEYGLLKKCVSGVSAGNDGGFYASLFKYFKEADSKYNSGLFDFKKDKLSAVLQVDNKVLKSIIGQLYYPVSPYEFSVLSVEILGSAYEQFLGKQIKLDGRHKVVVDEKPEVRKAGGVYYTPQYIVDYIVEQTVGKLAPLETVPGGKAVTPGDVAKLKIVDPACGSGSFLIGAYDYLMKWHVNYYKPKFIELSDIAGSISYSTKERNDAIKERSKLPLTPDGNLTSAIKKQILLNNIYGVDIDTQAVEVTKLSLLLKCMEGETSSSINAEMRFGERILPTLDSNIKSGNSLVDLDYYDGEMNFEPGADKKVKPFSWQQAFPGVFKQGGFDCVIGNPPYGAMFNQNEIVYFKASYYTSTLRPESYLLFIEKSQNLLKKNGVLGFIIPDTLLNLAFTAHTRSFIIKNTEIKQIVKLPSKIFSGAVVDTIILLTERKESAEKANHYDLTIKKFNKANAIKSLSSDHIETKINIIDWLHDEIFNLETDVRSNPLLFKIENTKSKIKDFAEIYSGVKAYEVGKGFPVQTEKIRDEKPYTSKVKKGPDWMPFYDGKDIAKYNLLWNDNNWINYGKWLAAPRHFTNFEGEKILIRKIISSTLIATYIPTTSCCNTLLFVLKLKKKENSYKELLGILNSKLIGWFFKKKFQISRDDTFPQIMIRDILEFPIPTNYDVKGAAIGKLVTQMLEINSNLKKTTQSENIEHLKQRIKYTEEKINQLVYELYELSEEEIKIVEEV
jgi:type I restriction-modification system DNA methylase subunit